MLYRIHRNIHERFGERKAKHYQSIIRVYFSNISMEIQYLSREEHKVMTSGFDSQWLHMLLNETGRNPNRSLSNTQITDQNEGSQPPSQPRNRL